MISPYINRGRKIPAETKARAMKMLRAGAYRCDVARATGISEYGVTKLARDAGIKYARCPRGSRWGKVGRAQMPAVAVPVDEPNYRAMAAALRWGGGLGGWRL